MITAKIIVATTVVGKSAVLAAPYATGVTVSIIGARAIRPYVIQTTEEKLAQFIQEEAIELLQVKTELSTCLMKYKSDCQRDSLGCPIACQDIADTFIILAGQDEYDKIIKKI